MGMINISAYPQVEVQRAIEAGILVRPDRCSECSRLRKVVAHHDDYAKPEEVRWLCRTCHALWHRSNGPGANKDLMGHVLPKELRATGSPGRVCKLTHDPRFNDMANLRASGWKLDQIGEKYKLSRERVRQIIGTTNKPLTQNETAFERCAEVVSAWFDEQLTKAEIKKRFGLTEMQIAMYQFPARPKRITHGTRTGYNRGCKCDKCRGVNAAAVRKRYRDIHENGLCIYCYAPSETWICRTCKPLKDKSQKAFKVGRSGVRGVGWNTATQGWKVYRYVGGKQICYGYFRNLEDAKRRNSEIPS